MRKYIVAILIITTIIFLFSCNEQRNKKSTENIPEIKQTEIELILNQIFLNKFPNFADNDIVRQKAFKEFNGKVDSLIKAKEFIDIPLRIYSIGTNPNGKGAIVQLYADEYEPANKAIPIKIIYNVIGFMNEDKASRLSENSNQTYSLVGHNYKRATETMTTILTSSNKYPTEQKILDRILDTYYINLGTFICEVDAIK